ncbi:tripartite tricarboxylate transporter TctB family protein [Granulosicoccus sp.]|nr:tripartite tricarboxylate transporter TctB family protein [Granulosicoccus sp.]MDB4222895.1 tripartite tricarboxylate transporter TctB family protein [Granulosicoccus sp.]
MGSQEYKIKVEYCVGAVVLLVGIFFIFQAFTIATTRASIGPRTLPMILAVSLVLGGLWLLVRAFRGNTGDLNEGYGFLESDVKRIFLVVGCGILFVATFWGFGYFLAVIVTLIAMLLTFGVRNWVAMFLGAIVLAIVFQWVFMGVMLLNDPKGVIVDMRPYTNWITGAK